MTKKVRIPSIKNVMYVKLNTYYASFLRVKYGNPVLFPKMSSLNQCVESYLINNPTSAFLNKFCYTQVMFEGNKDVSVLNFMDDGQITEYKQYLFIPVAIPHELVRFGKTIPTGPTWQLSNSGITGFRQLVKNDFWITFSSFWNDCKFRAERLGERANIECAISDFAVQYDINMKEYENLLRYWRRIRISINNEIEARRDILEQRTGKALEYTT